MSARVKIEITRALGWASINGVAGSCIALTSLMVLARYVSPAEYGLVAVVMVVMGLADLFADFGCSSFVIQRNLKHEVSITTCFISMMGRSIGAAVVVCASIPLVTTLFQAPNATGIMQVMACAIPLRSWGSFLDGLHQRQGNQRRTALASSCAGVIGSLMCAIPLAIIGCGAWSIILGYVVTSVARICILGHRCAVMHRFQWHRGAAMREWRYGSGVFISGVGAYASDQTDNMLVGNTFGVEQLGLYTRAFSVYSIPAGLCGQVVERTFFPIFSRARAAAQDQTALIMKVSGGSFLLMVPVVFLLTYAPTDVIALVLGSQWASAVDVLMVLAIVAPFRVGLKVAKGLLKANGHVYLLAGLQWMFALTVLVGSWALLQFGFVGVACGVSIATFLAWIAHWIAAMRLAVVEYSEMRLHVLRMVGVGIAVPSVALVLANFSSPEMGARLLLGGIALAGVVATCFKILPASDTGLIRYVLGRGWRNARETL